MAEGHSGPKTVTLKSASRARTGAERVWVHLIYCTHELWVVLLLDNNYWECWWWFSSSLSSFLLLCLLLFFLSFFVFLLLFVFLFSPSLSSSFLLLLLCLLLLLLLPLHLLLQRSFSTVCERVWYSFVIRSVVSSGFKHNNPADKSNYRQCHFHRTQHGIFQPLLPSQFRLSVLVSCRPEHPLTTDLCWFLLLWIVSHLMLVTNTNHSEVSERETFCIIKTVCCVKNLENYPEGRNNNSGSRLSTWFILN